MILLVMTPHPNLQALTDMAAAGPDHVVVADRRRSTKSAGRGPRILVAEDNIFNQKVVSMMLVKLGWDYEIVADGREALAALAASSFDLVLMDCHMPELDGFAATRQIRGRASGVPDPEIPIVALTADVVASAREECLAAGMNDFLPKPFDSTALALMIGRWVDVSIQT